MEQATKAVKDELLKPAMLEAWHAVGMEKLDIMDVCADSDTVRGGTSILMEIRKSIHAGLRQH